MTDECCGHHTVLTNGIGSSLIGLMDTVLDKIFRGEIAEVIIPDALLANARLLWDAIKKDWGNTYDTNADTSTVKWLNRTHNNLYAFSGAKNYSQLKELRTAASTAVSYGKFREEARKILDKYNELWLETEYEAVKRGTTMGRQWLDIVRDADVYPYLQYQTAEDTRVRKSHKALNGMVFSVDSEFWKQYYPPNGWNCRCTVKKLKKNYRNDDATKAMEMASASTAPYWRKNVGTTEIFEEKNTAYFEGFPKKNTLKATTHYNMPDVLSIYNKREDLEDFPKNLNTVAEFEAFRKTIALVLDYNQLPVVFSGSESNYQLASLIPDVLKNPDEVWSHEKQNVYLKYYKDSPAVVTVDVEGRITSHYIATKTAAEKLRKGILKKR